jgi:hypothetical protein
VTYAPDRHRDALPRQRATLSSRSAPEMKAARERPGPPACTAWSAKSPSSVRAGAPRRPKDSTDIGTKGRAEDTCRYARRLEASRAAAANPGARAAPTAKETAAGLGWLVHSGCYHSSRGPQGASGSQIRWQLVWILVQVSNICVQGFVHIFTNKCVCVQYQFEHTFVKQLITVTRAHGDMFLCCCVTKGDLC